MKVTDEDKTVDSDLGFSDVYIIFLVIIFYSFSVLP